MLHQKWDQTFIDRLLKSSDYRSFLQAFFEKGPWHHPKTLSFGMFSRLSGIASKSFMNDVMAGRKRITPSSFERVVEGLKLDTMWADYFKNQLAVEESVFRVGLKTSDFYQKKLLKARATLLKKSASYSFSAEEHLVRMTLHPDFKTVYASLGAMGVGEDLTTINQRSRIPLQRLKGVLEEMINLKIVESNPTRSHFIPKSFSLDAYQLGASEYLKRDFIRSLETAKARFDRQASSNNSLYLTQTFSVPEKKLDELRHQLAEMIKSFSDQAEEASGDCIAEICVSFTHNAR